MLTYVRSLSNQNVLNSDLHVSFFSGHVGKVRGLDDLPRPEVFPNPVGARIFPL